MKRCKVCGRECEDAAGFCSGCGSAFAGDNMQDEVKASTTAAPSTTEIHAEKVNVTVCASSFDEMSSTDKTLRLIAFVFAILSCIGFCWLVLPLAWMIPMTVINWGIYKGTRKNTVAFGVCSLLFLDFITGILLLCSTKED